MTNTKNICIRMSRSEPNGDIIYTSTKPLQERLEDRMNGYESGAIERLAQEVAILQEMVCYLVHNMVCNNQLDNHDVKRLIYTNDDVEIILE